MPFESLLIAACALGLFGLATLLAGRFSTGPGFKHRYRQTALLGIRVRSGSGLQGRSPQPRVRPDAHDQNR